MGYIIKSQPNCVCTVQVGHLSPLYNAPVFAASAVNVMAAQSVSIDKYPKTEQQVGERLTFVLGPPGLHNLLQLAELHLICLFSEDNHTKQYLQ